jgi:hypothetical protein
MTIRNVVREYPIVYDSTEGQLSVVDMKSNEGWPHNVSVNLTGHTHK